MSLLVWALRSGPWHDACTGSNEWKHLCRRIIQTKLCRVAREKRTSKYHISHSIIHVAWFVWSVTRQIIDLRYSDGRSNSLLNNATQRSVPQQHRFRSISFARLIVSYLRQHALCFRIPGRSLLAGRKRTRRSSVRGARQRTSNIYIY